ncbi:MAG: hypothetical protein BWK79_16130, partial [Beggiatoa sp. IS2]
METYPRQKLGELITNYGRTLCDEPKRLKGLLRDVCPQNTREVNVLLTALEQRIPKDLLSSKVPYELTAHRLIKRLYDDEGMAEEFARWAVDTWALALGVIQTVPDYPQPVAKGSNSPQSSQGTVSPPPAQGGGRGVVGQPFEFESITVNSGGKIIRKERKQARQFTEDLGNGVVLEMVYIPGGTFLMGAPMGEKDSRDDEKPQHSVTIQPFCMGKYPVTQAQWQAMMGNNPAHFKGDHRPVEAVSWEEAVEFCKKLSQHTGKTYQLPSESQWEYACRVGTTTPFHFGETLTTDLANYNGGFGWFTSKYRGETTPVGIFPPNAFGLHDIHGNVWEWCEDVWHENYVGAPTDGSAWVSGGEQGRRVLRGGSWRYNPNWVRSASRNRNNLTARFDSLGVRAIGFVR